MARKPRRTRRRSKPVVGLHHFSQSRLNDIICCFFSSNSANQFQKCARIRRERALAIFRYLRAKPLRSCYITARNKRDFRRCVRMKWETARRVYDAVRNCIGGYVVLAISGIVRGKGTEHDCSAYIDDYYYAKADQLDEIIDAFQKEQEYDRDHAYISTDGEYGLTISYREVTKQAVEKEKLIQDVERDVHNIMEEFRGSVRCE